jgi:hypothetical protein
MSGTVRREEEHEPTLSVCSGVVGMRFAREEEDGGEPGETIVASIGTPLLARDTIRDVRYQISDRIGRLATYTERVDPSIQLVNSYAFQALPPCLTVLHHNLSLCDVQFSRAQKSPV